MKAISSFLALAILAATPAFAEYKVASRSISLFELRTMIWQRESENGAISGAERHGIPENYSILEWASELEKALITVSDNGRFTEVKFSFGDGACLSAGEVVRLDEAFSTRAVWKGVQRKFAKAYKNCVRAPIRKYDKVLAELRATNKTWETVATEYVLQSKKLFGSLRGRCVELISPEPAPNHVFYVERCKVYDAD